MTLKAISQPKVTDLERERIENLKAIIESNERGKRAQAKIPVLQEKINALQDNVNLYQRLVASKDSTISDRVFQLQAMQLVVGNQHIMLQNKDEQLQVLNRDLQAALKDARRQKRVKDLLLSGGIAYAFYAVIKAVF